MIAPATTRREVSLPVTGYTPPDRPELHLSPPEEPGRSRRPSRLIRTLGIAGTASVVVAEVMPVGSIEEFLCGFGFFVLLVAASLVVATVHRVGTRSVVQEPPSQSKTTWRWTLAGLGVGGACVVQTWFPSGAEIARGDIIPKIGISWIGRIFAVYGWSGDNLGGPQANQGLAPLALLHLGLHALGGSDGLAQRVWLSLLVAGVLAAAGTLARSLALSPAAGVTVAVLYFFNPMTLSQVGFNDVYLVAMVLLAALPAGVIAHGRGTLRTWQLSAAFVASAPFIGYAYSNPPLVAMIAITTAVTPLLVGTRFGRRAAVDALTGLLVAGLLVVGASAYWLIPNELAVVSVAQGTLSSLSSWGFTEARSTLANGFWLNTLWSWKFPLYFPYSRYFAELPLILTRALVPLAALGWFFLPPPQDQRSRRVRRLAGVVTVGMLGIVFISTGTRAPGDLLFDVLYRLPYGWLLREPGRFLMAAALAFALLAGILVDQLGVAFGRSSTGMRRRSASRSSPRRWVAPTVMGAVIVTALASAFPLWTGTIIPGRGQGFPSAHVTVPAYWGASARYLNSRSAPTGALLVLPADDFYQMPYTWYYGPDTFISDLMSRGVVVPSGQGYEPASSELLNAVNLESQALLDGDWDAAERLLHAMGTPLVLVRGDVVSKFPQRRIASPAALAAALRSDPNMQWVHSDGPLSLYRLRPAAPDQVVSDTTSSVSEASPAVSYATTTSSDPDLRSLGTFPAGTAIVTSKPIYGHPVLVSLQAPSGWPLVANRLTTQLDLPAGWRYSVRSVALRSRAREITPAVSFHSITGGGAQVRITIPLGSSLLAGGSFESGAWSAPGNCDNATTVTSSDTLSGGVLGDTAPDGGSALQLKASIDSACESIPLAWSSGPFILRLASRSVSGSPPRLCLWEEPIARCAATPTLPTGGNWQTSSFEVTPDAGTRTLRLFLYADAPVGAPVSVEQYADVTARSAAVLPALVVVGTPDGAPSPSTLLTNPESYSPEWQGPAGSHHVLVDGIRNGWIVPGVAAHGGAAVYVPGQLVGRMIISFSTAMVSLAIAVWLGTWLLEERRRRGKPGSPSAARTCRPGPRPVPSAW